MAEKPEAKGTDEGVSIDVYWGSGEDLEPIYADQLHLQSINQQYYLTFGQLRPPLVKEGVPVDKIVAEIRPVAKLIVTREAFKRIAKLLNKHMKEGDDR
jgi:hypothetical protein